MRPFLPLLAGAALGIAGAAAGDVTLNAADLVRMSDGMMAAPALALPPDDPSLPIVAARADDPAAVRLRTLAEAGLARGFEGVLYDNRDRGHSALDPSLFPRLSRLFYGFELMAENRDFGLADTLIGPAVVFGNSSTAITRGDRPRSLVREAMTRPGRPERQARLHAANHLYVYPEHRDHDAVDLYPANWTYTLTSQGSSGSDQPFLRALAMTLAAFPDETFARMAADGRVASTLQSILRRALAPVATRADYLSGMAHPVVFDAALLRPERMVEAAAAMQPGDIPPMVRIAVVTEDFRAEAGLARLDERLFDTPSAVARIWRDVDWEREIVLSAAATEDPDGRPLTFEWRLLQGMPERVEIEPLDEAGHMARVRLRWHDAFDVPRRDGTRTTARVDIGVFASNGVADSAPAFLSVSFPVHQRRVYKTAPDGTVRLLSVDYDAVGRGAAYDPVLHWSAPWTDAPRYDPAGRITGWDRTDRDGTVRIVPHAEAGDAYRLDRAGPRPVLSEAAPPP
jgi:hypothetical protein